MESKQSKMTDLLSECMKEEGMMASLSEKVTACQ